MAIGPRRGLFRPNTRLPDMTVDMDFFNDVYVGASNTLASLVQCVRASAAWDATWTDAAGAAYSSYAVNAVRSKAGKGLFSEVSRTERFLNSTAPATQTITLTTGSTYSVWMTGTGSITVAAGTVVATGLGVCTAGNPLVIVVTGTGTATFTKAGTVDRCSVQSGAPLGVPQSFIETAGVAVTRSLETHSMIDPTLFPNNGTVLVRYLEVDGPVGTTGCIFSARIAAGNEVQLRRTTGNFLQWFSQGPSGGFVNLTTVNPVVANTEYKAGLVFQNNRVHAVFSPNIDSNLYKAPTPVGAPNGTLTTVGLGSLSATQQFGGIIRRVRWSPGIATDEALKKWAQS
jgi:hypothetical protein